MQGAERSIRKLLDLTEKNLKLKFMTPNYRMRLKLRHLKYKIYICNICRMSSIVQNKNYLTTPNETW